MYPAQGSGLPHGPTIRAKEGFGAVVGHRLPYVALSGRNDTLT